MTLKEVSQLPDPQSVFCGPRRNQLAFKSMNGKLGLLCLFDHQPDQFKAALEIECSRRPKFQDYELVEIPDRDNPVEWLRSHTPEMKWDHMNP